MSLEPSLSARVVEAIHPRTLLYAVLEPYPYIEALVCRRVSLLYIEPPLPQLISHSSLHSKVSFISAGSERKITLLRHLYVFTYDTRI